MRTLHGASEKRFDWFGFALVLAAHVGVLAWLYQQRIVQVPRSLEPLFVHFVTPEAPKPKPPEPVRIEPPKPRVERKPRPIEPPPQPEQIVVEAPPVSPQEPLAPPPPPAPPVVEAPVFVAPPPVEVPKPVGPVTLAAELSLSCPERSPPAYPLLSRRLKEEGRVLVRVELDEQGRVSAARIEKPSGSQRLDEAALAAVRTWRCTAARRDGKPARAVALQPFDFVLQ